MHSIYLQLFIPGLFSMVTGMSQNPADKNRLNEVYQKACHNCFEQKHSSMQQVLDKVNAIEIDFYDSKNILTKKGTRPGHWYVRHKARSKSGNNNCCYSSLTGQNDLDSCLHDVSDWCQKHPDHPLISIFLDKKQSWANGRNPVDLDKLILKYFDSSSIYKPADLKAGNASMRESATKGDWPDMQALKGKVLFGLTGGNILHPNKTLAAYARQRMNCSLIFVVPEVRKRKHIIHHPKWFSKEDKKYIVFFNLKAKHSKICSEIKGRNFLSRVFNLKEDPGTYMKIAEKANYIAVFNFRNHVFNDGVLK